MPKRWRDLFFMLERRVLRVFQFQVLSQPRNPRVCVRPAKVYTRRHQGVVHEWHEIAKLRLREDYDDDGK